MFFKNFKKDDSGAVTVDWVVMTAAVVGVGIATTAAVSTGLNDVAGDTSGIMEGEIISTSFDALADFVSSYSPLSSSHGPGWGTDPTWVEDTYSNWSALSDDDIAAIYTADYASAVGGGDPIRADYIAVQEQIMTDRGIDIPDGNLTAAQIAELYS